MRRLLGVLVASVDEHRGVALGAALVVGLATFLGSAFARNLRLLEEAHLLGSRPALVRADVGGTPSAWARPSAGYLRAAGSGDESMPSCGQVLIAPRVSVTAAHCVSEARRYVVGFGPAPKRGEAGTCRVSEVPVRSIRLRDGWSRAPALDLALLFLEDSFSGGPVARVAPSVSALLACGGPAAELETFVYSNAPGASERRRVDLRATLPPSERSGPAQVQAQAHGAGVCWGDSGSAVWDSAEDAVVGLLNQNSPEPTTYRCRMLTRDVWADCPALRCAADRPFEFLDLTAHSDWIAAEVGAFPWEQPPSNGGGVPRR